MKGGVASTLRVLGPVGSGFQAQLHHALAKRTPQLPHLPPWQGLGILLHSVALRNYHESVRGPRCLAESALSNYHLLSLRSLSLNKRTRVRQQCDGRKPRAGDRNLATTCRQTLSRCYLETGDVTCASLPGELHGWVLVLLPTSSPPTPLPNSTVKLALGWKENLLALLNSPPPNPKYHQLEMPFGKRVTSTKKLWKRLFSLR